MDFSSNKHLFFTPDGKLVLAGLFEETRDKHTKFKAPFTLEQWRRVYIEHSDPTEYQPAMELVGDWGHWLTIRNYPTLKPHFDVWQQEVEVKLRSEALVQMMKHSKKDGGTAASKWIAEGGYVKRDTRRKNEKQMEDTIKKGVSDRVSKDAERLGLKVIRGSK